MDIPYLLGKTDCNIQLNILRLEMTELLSIFATIITALGGIELIKWWYNRKSNKRLAVASADTAETSAEQGEWALLERREQFMQSQLVLKEERIADLTERLRQERELVLTLKDKLAEAEITHQKEVAELKLELAVKRCDRKRCIKRIPPNGY